MSTRSWDDQIRRRLPQGGIRPEMVAPAPRLALSEVEAPARSGTGGKSRFGLWVPILLGMSICLILGLVTVAVSAPAVASTLFEQATSTPPAQFAHVDIFKPSATPSPTVTSSPTVTPSPLPTETPGVLEVSIVDDTPVPVRSSVQLEAAPAYAGNKYILVDISEQHMYVYEGDTLIWSWVASTGMNNATRAGLFHVQSKIPNAYGATWNIWMPNWLGIYYSGGLENGIHALPILPNGARLWAGFLGRPISYGCVVLGVSEAEQLYNWAEIGTPVEIRW